jgi:hypothetical protein
MPNSVLENMKVNSTFQVDGFNSANTVMNEQLTRINEEIVAMDGVLNLRSNEMRIRLEIKRQLLDGDVVVYGPLYNVHGPAPTSGNIVDWHIDSTASIIIYQFMGTGWDGDATIIDLNNKWNWTSTYLFQPLGLGGSYGLVAKRDQLVTSIGVNNVNKAQIQQTDNMLP